jgi:hypothetical protein
MIRVAEQVAEGLQKDGGYTVQSPPATPQSLKKQKKNTIVSSEKHYNVFRKTL